MLAVVDKFDGLPALGVKITLIAIVSADNAERWLIRAKSQIGCGLSIRFDSDIGGKRLGDTGWADTLREALARARKLENAITGDLNAQRVALPHIPPEPPFKDQMVKLDEEMRKRILATPLTPDEEKEKTKLRTQEQANAFFEKREGEARRAVSDRIADVSREDDRRITRRLRQTQGTSG